MKETSAMSCNRCATLLAAISLVVMTVVVAQTQVLTGVVFGAVKDSSGAVLPGVTVTLTSPSAPGGPQSGVTDAKGEYRVTNLQPGTYSLNLQLQGFSTYQEQGLRVASNATTERNVALSVASVEETITVSGQSPVVDTRQTAVALSVPVEKVENIPTQHYSIQDLANLIPGNSPSLPGSDYGGQSRSIMGSLYNETAWLVDGVTTNNPRSGGGFNMGDYDAVQEVQMTAIGASAEYQIAQGGVFSVITKSGTNSFAGSLNGNLRPDALVSKPITVACNCAAGQTGFISRSYIDNSAHLGGPIVRDRVWFFGGGHWKGLTSLVPGQDPGPLPPGPYDHDYAQTLKVTATVTKSLRFMSMYEHESWQEPAFPDLTHPIETIGAGGGRIHTYSDELTDVLSGSTLLTIRASGSDEPGYTTSVINDFTTPQHTDLLTGAVSGGIASHVANDGSRHAVAAKLSQYIKSKRIQQDIHGGFQFEHAYEFNGTAYPGGANYFDLAGAPNYGVFRQPFVSGAAFGSWGGWIDDQLTVGRATFQLGLRYDHMAADSPDLPGINGQLQDTGNTIKGLGHMFTWQTWSPRTGVTIKLTDDSKTVLRGTYGRYYSPVFLDTVSGVHPGVSPSTTAQFDPATGGYTTILQVVNPLTNISVDQNAQPQYTDQYSVGFDREVAKNTGFTISYVRKQSHNQLGWSDIGGVYAATPKLLANGDTLLVQSLVNSPSARRFLLTNPPGFFTNYNALILSLNKRYAERWLASINYTFSKGEGLIPPSTASTLSSFGQDPNDYVNLTGRLNPQDRPHIFSAQAMYQVPKIDVQLAPNFVWQSGVAYAAQAALALPQGTRLINIDAPGSHRTPALYLLDLRANKEVWRRGARRVEAILDVRNLLQDEGFQALKTKNFASPLFGQPAAWIPPRMAILGARVSF
jgi:hypothetical protein